MNKLDIMYGEFLKAPHTPIKIDLNSGITFVGKTQDAFVLKLPITGSIMPVSVTKTPEKDAAIIVRATFSYIIAEKIEKDIFSGFMFLSLLKNAMMSAVAEYVNLDDVEIASFERPGRTGVYFSEVSEAAGKELRFYVKLKDINKVTGGN